MKRPLAIAFVLIFSVVLFQSICLADDIVGTWGWHQLAVHVNHNASLCVGNATFVETGINPITHYREGTWTGTNYCKGNNHNCYNYADMTGNWVDHGNGLYRVYLPDGVQNYFYDIFVKGDVAVYSVMSTVGETDIGNYEYGRMLRNADVSAFYSKYENKLCP